MKKYFLFLIISLILLPFVFASMDTTHTTKVYRCVDGTKTFVKEIAYGDPNWEINYCLDPAEINIMYGYSNSAGCFLPENEPNMCNTKTITGKTCYEAIEGKCEDKQVYGDCGFRQFSTLQECVDYVDYHKKLESSPAPLLSTNKIIIIAASVITILLIIMLIFLVKSLRKK